MRGGNPKMLKALEFAGGAVTVQPRDGPIVQGTQQETRGGRSQHLQRLFCLAAVIVVQGE